MTMNILNWIISPIIAAYGPTKFKETGAVVDWLERLGWMDDIAIFHSFQYIPDISSMS